MSIEHFRVCHLCEAACGLIIQTENNQVVSIKGDDKDPLSRGHICPKAVALQDIHEDPDRLRVPMKRTGNNWQEISWNQALDEVAQKLLETQKNHGANAVAGYFGNPSVHNWGMMTHAPHLFKQLKTRSRYSATSIDQLPLQLVCYWLYGHQVLVPVPDIDRTELLVIMGGNPMASNGSLWTVPGFRQRAKALQKRGGKIIVIDPRRSETAEIADQHEFIKPGSDAFLLLAMIRQLFVTGSVDTGRLTNLLEGVDSIKATVEPFTLELAEQETGISAATVIALTQAFANADRAVFYGRLGVCVQAFGTLCQWAIQVLNVLTGNLDEKGGAMFSLPAVDTVKGPNNKPGHFAVWKTRVRGLPEFGGELPCSALAEEMLTPGEGQIKALITAAGNPVLSTPNGRQLEEAFKQLDFMVSIDIYLNETTQHADIILPPTSPLEHDHYDIALMAFAVRNTAKYSPAVFNKPEGSLHDWEIFTELGKRMAALTGGSTLPDFSPEQILDMGLQAGPYGVMQGHEAQLNLEKLKANPEGVDFGEHESRFPERLCTNDKIIHLLPAEIAADIQRLLARKPEANQSSFQLIGRRHVRSNNSWMHNYQRLMKGKARHQLHVHPKDAVSLGIEEGDWVELETRVGSLSVEAAITDSIMEGVVSLPHGWGHNREGARLAIAKEHAGASANDITDDQYLDALSGNAAVNGVPVNVRKRA